ncbi:MAG: hypothetical protein LBU34_02885 [Planctomycetaceae bacterium]|jgi:hypothetical protein|nr:hypothetical protein [Planctomycetaceae bacterium]
MKHTNNQIKKDQIFFNDILGPPLPSFSHLPNIVMPSYPKALKYILRVISRKGCECFNQPPFDRTDHIDDPAEYMYLWSKADNQNYLIEKGCYYPQMVLDANTNIDLLKQLDVEDTFIHLINNIDKYRWFYMPMSDEESVSIFICRTLDKPWIERIIQKFNNVHIPYTIVIKQGNRDTWQRNDELRKYWRLNIGS